MSRPFATGVLLIAASMSCGGAPSPSAKTPSAAPATRLPDDAIIETMLGRLEKAADCPGSKRVWCLAAKGWERGTPSDLPAGERALAGVSIGLERRRADDELLAVDVALSALVLRGDGERFGLITDIPPENAAERRIVDKAIASVARVLRGDDERVELAPSLARYLGTLPAQAAYPLAQGISDWRMVGKSPARLRKIGRVWMAIEVPQQGPEGIFVSLYPE